MKLLVIDDDTRFTSSLYYLFYKSYTVHIASRAELALAKLRAGTYDLILLDLNLPDASGQPLYDSVRATNARTPIVVLSGSNNLATKVAMLNSGASDYITKPVYAEELRARIATHTKKQSSGEKSQKLMTHDLVLDTASQLASRAGKPIFLRRREYAVLECLMLNMGKTVDKELLTEFVWEESGAPSTNSIHVQVNHLRQKIEIPGEPRMLITVYGIGYQIVKMPPKEKE